jgi:anaerobic selenocysteine-containing dehydrogenase
MQLMQPVARPLGEARSHGLASPAECAGVVGGDRAALVSPRGRLEVRVEVDPALRSDTVVVPKGGWHKHGRNMNVLVEPRFTAGTGSAFNQNLVRLELITKAEPR